MGEKQNIGALAFDAYGTLFDVSSAVRPAQAAIGPSAAALSATWRKKQLEYTWLRSLMKVHTDFWKLTEEALDYALEAHPEVDPSVKEVLMNAYLQLEAYPEVAAALKRLKAMNVPTVILSNGTPDMLNAGASSAGIRQYFDALLSVETVGIFKPDAAVYQMACDHFDLPASQIGFLSSNAWDVAGAAHFGLQVIWVNRFNQPGERVPGTPKWIVENLSSLPDLIAGKD